MSKLRVESFTISLDGFGAGPDQDRHMPIDAYHKLKLPQALRHWPGRGGVASSRLCVDP
jgi:hypothetical protein